MHATLAGIMMLMASFAVVGPSKGASDEKPPLVLVSPDGTLELRVLLRNRIYYSVIKNGTRLLDYSPLSLHIEGRGLLGEKPKLKSEKRQSVRQTLTPIWGQRKTIVDAHGALELEFDGGYSVEFRVFDKGVAYRFATHFASPVTIAHELVEYRLPDEYSAYFPTQPSYETQWAFDNRWKQNTEQNIHLPLLVRPRPGFWVALTESDVRDYPSLFLQRARGLDPILRGAFERVPTTVKRGGFNDFEMVADSRGNCIARTGGTRTLPWRIFMVGIRDIDLVDNDLVYLLAPPPQLRDTSWIKPGKVAWEWWHDYHLHGVDFKTGVNTKTYLYHVDFAARHGLEYVLIDWKWTDSFDLSVVSPEVDIQQITAHAKKSGVKVIVWCPAFTLVDQLERALDNFARWGISGIKVDFFGRDDQLANRMYEDIAVAAAKRKLIVDFHGCAKPSGLHRTYPNVLNYEAVAGGEGNKFGNTITPEHNVLLPFIRGLAGPMDYTPGGMRNAAKGQFHVVNQPMTQGTRAHQMAMYVVFFEPLKMLVDSPTAYEREPDVLRFIAGVPTVWDETRVLAGEVGKFIVMARRRGTTWWVGALNNWDARDIVIDWSMLDLGPASPRVERFVDGVNADSLATDFTHQKVQTLDESTTRVHLARGGGAIFRIESDVKK